MFFFVCALCMLSIKIVFSTQSRTMIYPKDGGGVVSKPYKKDYTRTKMTIFDL